jgi:hypothetical protein
MASKKDFTPEEWTKVLESMIVCSVAVSAADPSGLWGTLKEALASKSILATSKSEFAYSELVVAAIAELDATEGRLPIREDLRKRLDRLHPTELVQHSLDHLREVSVILDTKAPADAAAFKALLCSIGQAVADASMEGGLLGFGGVKVSESEKATLADIAKALGTAA